MYELGIQFKTLRQIAEMSQDDVSDISGLGRNQVIAIEKGTGNPTLQTIYKFIKAVNGNLKVEPMRRVKVSEIQLSSTRAELKEGEFIEKEGEFDMKCWIGVFHRWGSTSEGDTIAVIENVENGDIRTIFPNNIRFCEPIGTPSVAGGNSE